MTSEDFYEDDEPIEEIEAAFEAGTKGVTAHLYWSGSQLSTMTTKNQ